jgi:hypothetical protein
MTRLEDIITGANVTSIAGGTSVDIVATKWHGTNAVTVM